MAGKVPPKPWVAAQGEQGDFVRQFVLDPVMTGRISERGFASALDVGCGEGRFCRVLRGHGQDRLVCRFSSQR